MVRSLALWSVTLGLCLSGCVGGTVGRDDAGLEGDLEESRDGGPGMLCEEIDNGDVEFKSVVEQLERQGLAHSRAIAIGLFVQTGRFDAEMAQCP